MLNYLPIMLVLVTLPLTSYPKLFTTTILISQLRRQNGWFFMDRMVFDEGQSVIKFSVKIQANNQSQREELPVHLSIISDQAWQQQHEQRCDSAAATTTNTAIRQLNIILKKSLEYLSEITQRISIDKRTTLHFVFKDCWKSIANQYFRKNAVLILSLQMRNGDYQYGADEHLYKYLLPLLLLLSAWMLNLNKHPKHRLNITQERNFAKLILFIGLLSNLLSLTFNYIGFLIYSTSGLYHGFFDSAYLLFHSISQSFLSSLIILIGFGWTITFTTDTDLDLFYIPLIAMLGLTNLILTMMCKINDGDWDKYHMYDSIPAYLLVIFRILNLLCFLTAIIFLQRRTTKNPPIQKFLLPFTLIGTSYFLSLPLLIPIVSCLTPSSRKHPVFWSVELIKTVIYGCMTWMLTGKGLGYWRVRKQGQSFFQEGGKLL